MLLYQIIKRHVQKIRTKNQGAKLKSKKKNQKRQMKKCKKQAMVEVKVYN